MLEDDPRIRHEYPSLRVRNTFLEFPSELWTASEDTPRPRRVSSQPPPCTDIPDGDAACSSAEAHGNALALEAAEKDLTESDSAEAPSESRPCLQASNMPEAHDQDDREVPSVGSLLHGSGRCKPCAFVHKKGCETGASCRFCHLCGPDEKQRRQKERWDHKRRQWRQFRVAGRQERQLARFRPASSPSQALAS